LKKSCRTSTLVPGALPAALTSAIFAAVDDDLRAFGRMAVAFARGQDEPADAGDAGQGLAAKTHGGNGREVLGALDFAGGVAFEAEQRVVAAHARPVVGHAHEAAAAGLDFDGDARRLRIERVFDQFLHDAGGALDHFAGGDLVGNLFGKQADAVHRPVPWGLPCVAKG
jgi:hypothetical protein